MAAWMRYAMPYELRGKLALLPLRLGHMVVLDLGKVHVFRAYVRESPARGAEKKDEAA